MHSRSNRKPLGTTVRIKLLAAIAVGLALTASLLVATNVGAQDRNPPPKNPPSSFMPVIEEPFEVVRDRDKRNRQAVMAAGMKRLEERYDLSRRVDPAVKMTRGKPIPVGPTARLKGVTWEQLGQMSPDEIKAKGVFPYLPLPHVNHPVGGMVFPQTHIKQEPRLERFDMDFDIPDHFLPEFPPAIFLTTRPDLGDVSKGQLVTVNNFFEMFNGLLNPKQLEGLRLLVTPFPQQQFNQTEDRRTVRPHRGVTCFD